jgi:hypothetical protein
MISVVLLSGMFGGGDFDCVDGLVELSFWLGTKMVLGEASPRPPVEGTERLPSNSPT